MSLICREPGHTSFRFAAGFMQAAHTILTSGLLPQPPPPSCPGPVIITINHRTFLNLLCPSLWRTPQKLTLCIKWTALYFKPPLNLNLHSKASIKPCLALASAPWYNDFLPLILSKNVYSECSDCTKTRVTLLESFSELATTCPAQEDCSRLPRRHRGIALFPLVILSMPFNPPLLTGLVVTTSFPSRWSIGGKLVSHWAHLARPVIPLLPCLLMYRWPHFTRRWFPFVAPDLVMAKNLPPLFSVRAASSLFLLGPDLPKRPALQHFTSGGVREA